MLSDDDLKRAKDILVIDEHDLQKECLRQARLALRWLLLEADAKLETNRAKAKLELTEARLRRVVRATPEGFKLKDKPTEAMIGEVVTTMDEYQAAVEEYNQTRAAQDQLAGIVACLTDRRRMIEGLIELKQIEYYGDPRPRTAAGREAMTEAAKTAARRPLSKSEPE